MRKHEELILVIRRKHRLEQFLAVIPDAGFPAVQHSPIKGNFHICNCGGRAVKWAPVYNTTSLKLVSNLSNLGENLTYARPLSLIRGEPHKKCRRRRIRDDSPTKSIARLVYVRRASLVRSERHFFLCKCRIRSERRVLSEAIVAYATIAEL